MPGATRRWPLLRRRWRGWRTGACHCYWLVSEGSSLVLGCDMLRMPLLLLQLYAATGTCMGTGQPSAADGGAHVPGCGSARGRERAQELAIGKVRASVQSARLTRSLAKHSQQSASRLTLLLVSLCCFASTCWPWCRLQRTNSTAWKTCPLVLGQHAPRLCSAISLWSFRCLWRHQQAIAAEARCLKSCWRLSPRVQSARMGGA